MNHNFLLLDRRHRGDYMAFLNHADSVGIHDDAINQFAPMLRWITLWNPAMEQHTPGLCLYGPTEILHDAALDVAIILKAWASMLALGPSLIQLTDGCVSTPPSKECEINVVQLEREPLLSALRQLIDWCEQVLSSGGQLFVLHLGI